MRWIGFVIFVAVGVGCSDREAAELERVRDDVCACKRLEAGWRRHRDRGARIVATCVRRASSSSIAGECEGRLSLADRARCSSMPREIYERPSTTRIPLTRRRPIITPEPRRRPRARQDHVQAAALRSRAAVPAARRRRRARDRRPSSCSEAEPKSSSAGSVAMIFAPGITPGASSPSPAGSPRRRRSCPRTRCS